MFTDPFPSKLGNLDIWSNILAYLEAPSDGGSVADVNARQVRQRAMLGVALLSPALTAPALDSLWKTMTSLQPVARVLNGTEDLLRFQEINYGGGTSTGSWILLNPVPRQLRARAVGYLARIQHCRFLGLNAKEVSLWLTLAGILVHSTLLPNLKSLALDLTQYGSPTQCEWLNSIFPIIPSTLKTISYTTASSTAATNVEYLQNMFKSRSLDLARIVYRGFPSSTLLRSCMQFEGLDTLKLNFEGHTPSRSNLRPVIPPLLGHLRQLRDLEIDLRLFHHSQHLVLPAQLPALRVLHIIGDGHDLLGFFQHREVTSVSLLSFSATVWQGDTSIWTKLCNETSRRFPSINSLSLRTMGSRQGIGGRLVREDLTPMSSLPITSFCLDGVSHSFNQNLHQILESFPRLQKFKILNQCSTYFDASAVLPHLSQGLPRLHELWVPLDLASFGSPLHIDNAMGSIPLRRLCITGVSGGPPSLEGSMHVVKNLLRLFPLLNDVAFVGTPAHRCVTEIQQLFVFFHASVAIFLNRAQGLGVCQRR